MISLKWFFWRQRRYLLTLMLFLGFFNVYSLRVNLSVAIVAMTSNSSGSEPEFDWNSKQQGVILSSFFYGYIMTMFASGILANKFGGCKLFGGSIISTSILTILSPNAASHSYTTFVVVRIVEGFLEGATYPSLHAIWSKWAPPLERSRLNAIAFAGSYVGTVIMMPVSGWLSENYGWRSVFYVTGIIGCIWFLLWILLISESPTDDKFISKEEQKYILDSLKMVPNNKLQGAIPFKAIFTSKPVWAINVANFAENWGFYTLLTQLPTFLNNTLSLNLKSTGFISGLPYLAMACMLIPSGWLADFCQERKILTTTQVRKYFNCGGFIAQCSFMILAIILAHPIYSILSLIVAVGLGAFSISGFAVNHLDIAPQYASLLMGISNTFGTLPGILSPIATGYIVQNKSAEEWNVVFGITATIYFIGSIFYWILVSGELQPWAKNDNNEEPKNDNLECASK